MSSMLSLLISVPRVILSAEVRKLIPFPWLILVVSSFEHDAIAIAAMASRRIFFVILEKLKLTLGYWFDMLLHIYFHVHSFPVIDVGVEASAVGDGLGQLESVYFDMHVAFVFRLIHLVGHIDRAVHPASVLHPCVDGEDMPFVVQVVVAEGMERSRDGRYSVGCRFQGQRHALVIEFFLCAK